MRKLFDGWRVAVGGASVAAVLLAAALLAGCEKAEAPIGQRAMEAYQKHDYKAALPLLKKWAESPEVATDKDRRNQVLLYLVDTQNQLSGKLEKATAAATTIPAAPTIAGTTPIALAAPAPARVPHTPIPPGEMRQMTIKELGNFDFDPEKDSDVPADVKALSGSKLRLRGFILPLNQAEKITDFALVPSLFNCCFGQPPGTQHIITCRIPPAHAVEYVTDEVWVEGTLKVHVVRDQDYTSSIFELDVTSVKLVE